VDGFVIFHTKLSTPRLGSFICSSLILQGSWSDHYNLKKKRKRHSSMVCESWHPMESVSHGLRKERWGGVTRVNSTNVLDEGLRIGEIGRRMNSMVKLVEIGVCRK
jgi:hypothetical protein